MSESFFNSIRGELLDGQAWPTRVAARTAIVEYLSLVQRHPPAQHTGYLSPAEYEASHHNTIANVA